MIVLMLLLSPELYAQSIPLSKSRCNTKSIIQVLRQLEPVFSERVWEWAKVLLVGAILTPGRRTVSAAQRVMGLSAEAQYQNYHRVLNRAVWSSRQVSERLLHLLVDAFVPADEP